MATVMKTSRFADGTVRAEQVTIAEASDPWDAAPIPFKPTGGPNAGPIGALMSDAGGHEPARRETARLMGVPVAQLELAHLRAKLETARTEAAAAKRAAKHDEVDDETSDWEDEDEEGEDDETPDSDEDEERAAAPKRARRPAKPAARVSARPVPKPKLVTYSVAAATANERARARLRARGFSGRTVMDFVQEMRGMRAQHYGVR